MHACHARRFLDFCGLHIHVGHMCAPLFRQFGYVSMVFALAACAPQAGVQDQHNKKIQRCLTAQLGGAQTPLFISVEGRGQPVIFDERPTVLKKKDFPTFKDIEKARAICVPRRKTFNFG